jgi:ElaB/YqjD/DUF883 family membrane-anchored ribosome-binding protein
MSCSIGGFYTRSFSRRILMAPATAETHTNQPPSTVRDRAADVVRQATHFAHEARQIKTLAADAVEDGVHAARRAMTRGMHGVEDLRDAAAYRVKRAPFMTVGLAFAGGVLLGVAFGWIGRKGATQSR